MSANDGLLTFKFVDCNKPHEKNDDLLKRFQNTFKLCDGDINIFFFFFFKLRKGAYPYEYIDGWEIFKETSLPGGGKRFTATWQWRARDYKHAKRAWEDFGIQDLGLFVQSDTLLLVDVFESLTNKCLDIY